MSHQSSMMSILRHYSLALGWIAVTGSLWYFGSQGADAQHLLVLTSLAYLTCWTPFFAFSRLGSRQKVIRFVVVSTSLVISILALELTAKLGIDYRQVFNKRVPHWENTRNLLDPELIYVRPPYFRKKFSSTNGGDLHWGSVGAPALTIRPIDVKFDRNGFRNNTDYDQVDCVVIGDSFVGAGNVSSEEIHTNQIAKSLGLTVANLGLAGYGPQQELKVLERVGIPLHPKICVWMFFEGNDLEDVWRYRELLSQWQNVVTRYHSWRQRSFIKNLSFLLSRQLNKQPQTVRTTLAGRFPSTQGEQYLWFGYDGKALTPKDSQAVLITAETIQNAHRLCKNRGIQLVVAFAPTKYRVYADLCTFEENSPIQDWVVNPLPEQLSQAINSEVSEIVFIDLTPHLKEAAEQGRVLYYPDDSHWSPEGHQVVAEAISNFLRTN